MSKVKWDFRDVSLPLKMLRDKLLGRMHNLHNRFPPLIAPRSIPPPEVPRGPEYKYSNQFYCHRNPRELVKPPVVAPVALGPSLPSEYASKGQAKRFDFPPTPGPAWWWDGHCYFECTPDQPPDSPSACPQPCPPPGPPPSPTAACPPPPCPAPACPPPPPCPPPPCPPPADKC